MTEMCLSTYLEDEVFHFHQPLAPVGAKEGSTVKEIIQKLNEA